MPRHKLLHLHLQQLLSTSLRGEVNNRGECIINELCDQDPVAPNFITYTKNCEVPKEGHLGKFPANFCVKMIGVSGEWRLSWHHRQLMTSSQDPPFIRHYVSHRNYTNYYLLSIPISTCCSRHRGVSGDQDVCSRGYEQSVRTVQVPGDLQRPPRASLTFKPQHCFRMTRWTAASSPATMTAVTRQPEQTLSSVSKTLELDFSCAQEDRRRFNPFHAKCCFLILLIQFQPEWWMDGNGYESKMMVEWKIIGIQSITMHGEKALHFQEHLSFLFYSKIFSHFRFIDNDLDCYCSIITVSIHELFSMDIHYDIMNKSRFCWNIIFCFLFIKLSIVRKNNEDMKVKM